MGIGQLIADIGKFVPPWLLGILIAVLLVLAAPGWLTGLKVKKVKAILRQTTRADETERKALQQQALDVAQGKPEVLVALVREADKMNLPRLRDRAMKALKKFPSHADVVRQMKKPADPQKLKGSFGHPVEAAVRIRTLVENGAVELAREKLAEANAKFPGDPELAELQTLVQETAS